MRIAVCIKQEWDATGPFHLTEETKALDTSGLVEIVDPSSLAALVLIRSSLPAGEHKITALTVGPRKAERSLRTCLAMGADEAVRIWDSGFDREPPATAVVAKLLAAAVKEYDLIVCGSRSLCGGSGYVGPAIADALDLPQVCSVSQWECEDNGLTVQRRLEHGDREIVHCTLPVVLTVDEGAAEAPYPSFPAMLAAEEGVIEVLDLAALGLKSRDARDNTGGRFEKYIPPRPRTKKAAGPDMSGMSEAEKMKLLSGGGAKARSSFVEGPPEKAAKKIVDFLVKNDLLSCQS